MKKNSKKKFFHHQTQSTILTGKTLNLSSMHHGAVKTNLTIQDYINKKLTQMNSTKSLSPSTSCSSKEATKYKKSNSQNLLFHPKEKKLSISMTAIESEPNNEIMRLKNENNKLKKELTYAKQKIEHLEKMIQNFIMDNSPISKPNCPQPTPYVQRCDPMKIENKNDINASILELTLTNSTMN